MKKIFALIALVSVFTSCVLGIMSWLYHATYSSGVSAVPFMYQGEILWIANHWFDPLGFFLLITTALLFFNIRELPGISAKSFFREVIAIIPALICVSGCLFVFVGGWAVAPVTIVIALAVLVSTLLITGLCYAFLIWPILRIIKELEKGNDNQLG